MKYGCQKSKASHLQFDIWSGFPGVGFLDPAAISSFNSFEKVFAK
jgi:hypothetical protein